MLTRFFFCARRDADPLRDPASSDTLPAYLLIITEIIKIKAPPPLNASMRSIRRLLARVLPTIVALFVAASSSHSQAVRGTIEGRVLNADRTPASKVYVIAWESPDAKGMYLDNPVAIGITDAEGGYRLSDMPPGRYKLFANMDWYRAHDPKAMDTLPVVAVRSGRPGIYNFDLPQSPAGVTVSGRIMGDVLDKDLQSIALSSSAVSLRSDVDFDGSFVFRGVPPGSYSVTSEQSPRPFLWTSREVNVEDRDITSLELAPPGMTLPVMGRIVVEGAGPAPSFFFALEGSLGSAHSGWIWVTHTIRSGPMVVQTGWADRYDDVIFNASLPIGVYRIALGGLPPGYRIKSFTYGNTNLLENPINATGKLQQLSITLVPPTDARVRKIRGRIIRDVALPPDITINTVRLASPLLLTQFDLAVARDGSFEASGVPQGVYGLNVAGLNWKITVPERGVDGLEFRISRILVRREEMFRRSSNLSTLSSTTQGEAQTATQSQELRGSLDVKNGSPPSFYLLLKPDTGSEIPIFFSGTTFSQRIPLGTYRVAVGGLENRYQIQSLTYGDVDLQKEFLRITPNGDGERKVSVAITSDDRARETDAVADEVPQPFSAVLKTVQGQVVVEGGLPLPVLTIAVRPNVDVTEPPFSNPYKWNSRESETSFNIQSDGHFSIGLPEGRHRIRVDPYPESLYRLKSVKYGSSEIVDGYVEVDGGRLRDLVITIAPAPHSSWTKAKGLVRGFDNMPVGGRVILLGKNTRLRIEATPASNGSFEFPKVPPDTYTLSTVPRMSGVVPQTGIVIGRESPFLSLAIPKQHLISLQFNDNSPLTGSLILTVNRTETYTVFFPASLVMRTAGEMVCVVDVCSPSFERLSGSPMVVSTSPDRKTMVLRLAEGEYLIHATGFVSELEVKSLSGGSVILNQDSLVIGVFR